MPTPKSGFRRYDLIERVIDALPAIGYKTPSEVQHKVIPLILQRRNLIVEAATGTGKTAAYGLALISRIDFNKRNTQVLVLVPSRELALQVESALRTFCTHDQFRVSAIYGGEDMKDSERKLKSGGQILVAVPGRLKDVLRLGAHDRFWRDIKYLVIDEADKMLEAGFQDILDNLVSNVRNNVQVALFSATISADAEELIRERFSPITTVRLSPKEALKNIRFHYVMVDKGQKPRYLAGVLRQHKIPQGLIFCSKREEVYELANFLRSVGRKAESYHGLLDQVEREAILGRFRGKQVEFLVATDLAARGLDVQDLPAVINYSFPDDLEVYLHRCGRTGRMGKRGQVFNLVASGKEEIVVQRFHTELQIALGKSEVKPVSKEEIAVTQDKLVKVHLNRGKKDKVAAGDVVGFLVNATGVAASAIGTIAVYDQHTIVDLPETYFEMLESYEALKLKGKTVKATRYTLADQKARSEAVRKSQLGVRDKQQAKAEAKKLPKKKAAAPDAPAAPKQRTKASDAAPKQRTKASDAAPKQRTKASDAAPQKSMKAKSPAAGAPAPAKPKPAKPTKPSRPGPPPGKPRREKS